MNPKLMCVVFILQKKKKCISISFILDQHTPGEALVLVTWNALDQT